MPDREIVWNLIAKKLNCEAAPEELKELEDILRKNPDLHYPIQTIMDLWSPSHTLVDQEEAQSAFDRHMNRMRELNIPIHSTDEGYPFLVDQARRTRKRNFWLLSSTLLLLLLFTGAYFFKTSSTVPATVNAAAPKTISQVTTQYGSKTSLVLPDGTKVWLNSGSTLSYDKNFDVKLREVVLSGEGFFDVVHNAEKPFIIHTAKINIKVLGTRFNVKSYPTNKTTEASLIRGSIEVSFKDIPSEKIILKPNEKIVVATDDVHLRKVETKKIQKIVNQPIVAVQHLTYEPLSGANIETSWVENKLIFQDESFEDLARQMERWYGVNISFKDIETQELHFTGIFKNESIMAALEALKLSNNFNYKITGNSITIYN